MPWAMPKSEIYPQQDRFPFMPSDVLPLAYRSVASFDFQLLDARNGMFGAAFDAIQFAKPNRISSYPSQVTCS